MSHYTLGIDTSNYATSLAVFHTAGEVVCAKKRFLPVKEGQLGLRQSDALFHHTTALPEMLEELGREFDLTRISAVGVSQKPRPVEGSYMPCFLAGVSAATAFAQARGIPLIHTTHQQGHAAAAHRALRRSGPSCRPDKRAGRASRCRRPAADVRCCSAWLCSSSCCRSRS